METKFLTEAENKQEIRFSVIMPTFKRQKHLRRAIESVLNQTYQNFTLYVIGDCCPYVDDFMLNLYKGFSETQKEKVLLYNLKKNHGPGGAGPRNWALQNLVTSDWVAYLDDDNFYKPNHLMEAVKIIRKYQEHEQPVSFICTNFEIETINGCKSTQIVKCVTPCKGRVDTSSVLHKRELINKYGGWKSQAEVGYSNDWNLYSRWIPNEPYACTNESTLVYNLEFNHQTYESILTGSS